MLSQEEVRRVREILKAVKPLAAEYYRLTGKPLGVTGEVAEVVAADALGLYARAARNALDEPTFGRISAAGSCTRENTPQSAGHG
jgi:hypothetical protein